MNFKNKMISVLMIVLTLGFYRCGSNGTNNQIPFNQNGAFSGFYVVSSTPAHNQFYVSATTTTIVIRMSEAVDQATIAGNVELIKTVGGQETNVTSSYTITVNGQIITLQGSGGLSLNADYQIRMYPALAATSGNTLLENMQFTVFYIDFSTGNGGTLGQSVAGPPSVASMSRSNGSSCFGATIRFNESLAYQPQVSIEYKDYFFQWHTVPAYALPEQSNNMTQWHVDMDPGYCSDIITGSNVKVHVEDYVDLEGTHGAAHSQSFTFWL